MNTDAMQWQEPGPSLARAVAAEFRLLGEIGRGGMGVVYLAEDTRLLRKVAIKTLLPHVASDPVVRERFIRESRTAAGLTHAGIVPIFAASEQAGVVYFVMRLVEGISLADRVAGSGPLAVREALSVVRQVAEALAYAHEAGVIHRDIKAENVLIDSTGRALITDFGIARMGEAQPLTATGTILGSVHYMSPEQISAEPVDGRSDLYSLGVLIYFLLTARFPFERPQASAVLVAHVLSPAPRLRELLPNIDPGVESLVARLLEKVPANRFSDARELCVAIDRLLAGLGDPDAGVIRADSTSDGSVASEAVADGESGRSIVAASGDHGVVLSSREAQEVWQRAADLQAHTGVMVPPPVFSARAPEEEALTRGYDLALVKEAAVEAGIDSRFVEAALAERALVKNPETGGGSGSGLVITEIKPPPTNRFLGAQTSVEFEVVLDGELPADAFELVAQEARRMLGQLVIVNVIGRTMTISTSAARSTQGGLPQALQVQVSVRNGRTHVVGFEDMKAIGAALFGGVGVGAGMGVGGMSFAVAMSTGAAPVIGAVGWVASLLASTALARGLLARSINRHRRDLRAVVEGLALHVRTHLAQKQLRP